MTTATQTDHQVAELISGWIVERSESEWWALHVPMNTRAGPFPSQEAAQAWIDGRAAEIANA